MQLETGNVYEGKVTGITKFGAFVTFEDGTTGMVHISEVAPVFVNEIKDFLTEGQVVKVRVLDVTKEGKISLSIKKAMERDGARPERRRAPAERPKRPHRSVPPAVSPERPGSYEWQSKKNDTGDFEDMMQRFKQTSDEKISDLKKASDNRRGYSKRGSKG